MGISECEARWAAECVLPKLNHRLCEIAQERGWNYVGGIADSFRDHGWCAHGNWINTIGESISAQGHYRGRVHPNERGYEQIGKAVAGAIKMKLLGVGPPPPTCAALVESPVCDSPCK